MRHHRTTLLAASLAFLLLCTLWLAASPPSDAVTDAAAPTSLRPTVDAVWLIRTPEGWAPVEQAQPTVWIVGAPHTRYTVDRPGMEHSLTWSHSGR